MASFEKRHCPRHRHYHHRAAVHRVGKSPWFCNKQDAKAWANQAELDRIRFGGMLPDAVRARQTFRAYVEHTWFPLAGLRPTTRANYRSALDNHVYPVIGEIRIGELRRSTGSRLLRALEDTGLAPGTVRRIWGMTSGVLNYAVEDDVLARNPFRGLHARSGAADVQPIDPETLLSTEEVFAQALAMPDRYQRLVIVAAGTEDASGGGARPAAEQRRLPAPADLCP